ncbi:MAG: DUF58 domain-containing protein [Treponema sp.]|jgi:uncharacterized protein (DUF58 family)|nr:DUF58 domain-containing protein [Treponema sp.]
MDKKPSKITAAFFPKTTGIFVMLIIILSFTAAAIRGETALTLTGAFFLAIWLYCFLMTLLLALAHFRAAAGISFSINPQKTTCAAHGCAAQINAICRFSHNRMIFQFPGILVRCRVLLHTRDGRRVFHDFRPDDTQTSFQVIKRGAYYTGRGGSSDYNEFAVFDIFGFFRFAWRIRETQVNNEAALLVSPLTALESFTVQAKGGGSDRHDTGVPQRADDLTDHRPYVPGDDPRRINWKLYGHGGDLFIRQGEYRPPPQSNITILIDTQYDSLYARKSADKKQAAEAVDLLCECALAIINSAGKERNVRIGFTGQPEREIAHTEDSSLTETELRFYLAHPWAMRMSHSADLPSAAPQHAVIILALPRLTSQTAHLCAAYESALDRWLAKNVNRPIELFFIYDADDKRAIERAEAAAACVSLYSQRPGVTARIRRIPEGAL